jgi:mono/diheme cytochrome c family protein
MTNPTMKAMTRSDRRIVLVAVAALAIAPFPLAHDAPQATAAEPRPEVAESYRLNCAPCHGANGRLDPADLRYASFSRPPADLTRPTFNSMEPPTDWFMVTKYGGSAMGLSAQMPAFGGALDDAQIEELVAYLKTLADTRGYPPGDLNFLRPIRTIKPFPETELILLTEYRSREGDEPNRRKQTVYYGHRFGPRSQGEIKLSRIEEGGEDRTELELGYKWPFHYDLRRSLLAAAGLEAELPLNEDDASEVVIPYLSIAHGVSSAFTLQSTLRSHLPTEDVDAGDVELSAIVHWNYTNWPRRAYPGLEFKWVEPFRGRSEFTLLPQLLAGLSKRGHVALAVGVELPLTAEPPDDYRLHTFLLWDIPAGPFWQGW